MYHELYERHDYLQGQAQLRYTRDKDILRLFEHSLVSKSRNYPSDVVDKLHRCFYQIDIDRLEVLQTKRQHDPVFHRYMQYFTHALISNTDLIPDLRLRRLYTNIYSLDDSKTTYVIKCDKHPLFVLKVNMDNDPGEDHIPHEALIGLEVTNNLRTIVPNFVHTYEVYHCSFPLMNKDSAVWSLSDNGLGSILLLEYLHNAVPLEELAPNLSEQEFLQIYVQVINALNIAYKRYRFTHYDLHAGNVLIQQLSTPMYIPIYDKEGLVAYMPTLLLARIIDMEFTYAVIAGYSFGVSGLERYNVYPDKSFAMHDAYKLLLFTYEASLINIGYTNQLTMTAQTIYDFFGEKKSLRQRLLERDSHIDVDFYQPDNRHRIHTHDELLQYICANFDLTFSTGSTGYTYTPLSFSEYLLVDSPYNNLMNYYLSTVNRMSSPRPFDKDKAYRKEQKEMRKFLRCTIRDIKHYERDKDVESPETSDDIIHRDPTFIMRTLRLGEAVIKCKLWLAAVYYAFRSYPQKIREQAIVIDEYYAAIMKDLEL